MATIKPFAALRPKPELAERICELPYDVLSSQEASEQAAGNPFSFFRVSKSEIELPAATDPYDPAVYAKGRANFLRFIAEGWLQQDRRPSFYLYRQIMGSHRQVGLVAVASCEDYLGNLIKKHELTRVEKEEDRVRHIEALNAQTGPVFLTYRAETALDDFVAKQTSQTPAIDFTAKDGVRHSSWIISRGSDIDFIQKAFLEIRHLYIADGHHRCAAAARVYQSRKGAGNSRYFLSVIFPHNQAQILPYHRVLKDLNGLTPEALLKKLDAIFILKDDGAPAPARPHELGFYLLGQWRTLHVPSRFAESLDPMETLDATLLQDYVLAPVFGIDDPRTSERISFVGGIRGPAELRKLVDGGDYACAFSLFPPRIEDLMSIADASEVMPPKSTWFEPKLRDAMFCHRI